MKFLIISTTTNERRSSSRFLCSLIGRYLRELRHDVNFIDANKLNIVKNMSCYADGGKQCADPESGPYRCWAHKHAEEEPEKYGGKDEMSVIYDGLAQADAVIFATSVRWGNHTALLQTIIERMNTLENRHTVYGEPNPLWGKRCGVMVTGQHWKSEDVAQRLVEVFDLYGFDTSPSHILSWQHTQDMNEELEDNNIESLKIDLRDERYARIVNFVKVLT